MPKFAMAAGHDNLEELTRFKDIDGCLFQAYFDFVEIEWHTSEGRDLSGTRKYKLIGNPWFNMKFPVLTTDEWKYLFVTFMGSQQSIEVTIHAWDMDVDDYFDYNATMSINESTPDSYEWGDRKNVNIEFRDLVKIT